MRGWWILCAFLLAGCGAGGDVVAVDATTAGQSADGAVIDVTCPFTVLGPYSGPAEVGVQCPMQPTVCAGPYPRCCYGETISCTAVIAGFCNYAEVDCDGPEDCPAAGEVCCVHQQTGCYVGAECRPADQCAGVVEASCGPAAPACNSDADCPAGQSCCSVATGCGALWDFGTGVCLNGPCGP